MNKVISIELLNKIANYLATRPYIEVAQLIQEISQLPDVKEAAEPAKEEKK